MVTFMVRGCGSELKYSTQSTGRPGLACRLQLPVLPCQKSYCPVKRAFQDASFGQARAFRWSDYDDSA